FLSFLAYWLLINLGIDWVFIWRCLVFKDQILSFFATTKSIISTCRNLVNNFFYFFNNGGEGGI
ncbi:hypothetical protein, partial [Defluviitalea phaphyphila]|uniref:hypothetical protein n=1 Tax=Defluviitalea phaphyphila TaxID=1473580 RepID=UPI001A9A48F7